MLRPPQQREDEAPKKRTNRVPPLPSVAAASTQSPLSARVAKELQRLEALAAGAVDAHGKDAHQADSSRRPQQLVPAENSKAGPAAPAAPKPLRRRPGQKWRRRPLPDSPTDGKDDDERTLHAEFRKAQAAMKKGMKSMFQVPLLTSVADSKDSGFLPSVRSVCPPGLLDSHPFFEGVSDDFKEAIEAFVRPRRFDRNSSDQFATEIKDLKRRQGILSELFEEVGKKAEPTEIRSILEQGKDPVSNVDGILLMYNEDNAYVEYVFNGNLVARGSSCATIGQEFCMGLAQECVFTVRIVADPRQPMYFIPRAALLKLSQRSQFEADFSHIHSRTVTQTEALLRTFFMDHLAKLKVKLFANMSQEFKVAFMKVCQIRLHARGTALVTQGDNDPTVMCILQGLAEVQVDDEHLMVLNDPAQAAWMSWSGFMEVCASHKTCVSTVVAKSDCIVLELSAAVLRSLYENYSFECRIFDKVAQKMAQTMYQKTKFCWHMAYLFNGCDARFLRRLAKEAYQKLCAPGDVVVTAGDQSQEMYLLFLGTCHVRRVSARSSAGGDRVDGEDHQPLTGSDSKEVIGKESKAVATLRPGSLFGELMLLGVSDHHRDTVVCDTVCDLRVLPRKAFLDCCMMFPESSDHMDVIVQSHRKKMDTVARQLNESLMNLVLLLPDSSGRIASTTRQSVQALSLPTENLEKAQLGDKFLQSLSQMMFDQAFLSNQDLCTQGKPVNVLYVVMEGTVEIQMDGHTVGRRSAPVVIGETAVLGKQKHVSMATVRCVTVCDTLALHGDWPWESQLKDLFPDDIEFLQVAAAQIEAHSLVEREAIDAMEEEDKRRRSRPPEDPNADGAEAEAAQNKTEKPSFLARCGQDFLEALSRWMETRYFLDGQLLLRQGETGALSMVLTYGSAMVEVNGMKVDEVAAGDFLGEMVLLGMSPCYTASVRAIGLVKALVVDRENMHQVIQSFPEERRRLEEIMDKRRARSLARLGVTVKVVNVGHKFKTQKSRRVDALKAHPGALDDRKANKRVAFQAHTDYQKALAGKLSEAMTATDLDEGSDSGDSFLDDAAVHAKHDLTTIGQEAVLEYSQKVRSDRQLASARRRMRLRERGALVELLPPGQSYRVSSQLIAPRDSKNTPAAQPASSVRLRQAKGIYAVPVWTPAAGAPAALMDADASPGERRPKDRTQKKNASHGRRHSDHHPAAVATPSDLLSDHVFGTVHG
eukprot:TRINITY_DN26423_c0_g1_i2.p1 TRINITY_DN26423_c0_g1~~TRINITY_DN26423_c0_g1_i2.p1  ORF type:complete len:1214 (-),score=304.39 TRINITY_DN26423_c0_g1_i2:41-3682(-)